MDSGLKHGQFKPRVQEWTLVHEVVRGHGLSLVQGSPRKRFSGEGLQSPPKSPQVEFGGRHGGM